MITVEPGASTTRLLVRPSTQYTVRLTREAGEIRRAQALRFEVFNLELGGGLVESFDSGLDADEFDDCWDHLIVEHQPTGEIAGTYRLQTGEMAELNKGYYSAREFDFTPFRAVRGDLVELGRAAVHRQHRNLVVLGLLWKGIADYARARGARYLCGCSSLASQDPAAGASVYASLCRKHLVVPEWRTRPWPNYECSLRELADTAPPVPKLLSAYLGIGAKICGPPALDREFKTIVFLTFLDLESLPEQVRRRFLS